MLLHLNGKKKNDYNKVILCRTKKTIESAVILNVCGGRT